MTNIPTTIASILRIVKDDFPRTTPLSSRRPKYPSPEFDARRKTERENNQRFTNARDMYRAIALLEEQSGRLPHIKDEESVRILNKTLDAIDFTDPLDKKAEKEALVIARENIRIAAHQTQIPEVKSEILRASHAGIRRTMRTHVLAAIQIAAGNDRKHNLEHRINWYISQHGWVRYPTFKHERTPEEVAEDEAERIANKETNDDIEKALQKYRKSHKT